MMDTLFERVVPAEYESVSALRRATDAFLRDEAEERFRATLLLVVSELCTNAVEALGDSSASLTLRVHHFTDRVEIEVTDPGPGFTDALTRPGSSDSNPRGRGLQVVRSLVDELHVRRADGLTTVCCLMMKPGFAPA